MCMWCILAQGVLTRQSTQGSFMGLFIMLLPLFIVRAPPPRLRAVWLVGT